MPTTGLKLPGTASGSRATGGGNIAWVSSNNIKLLDGLDATADAVGDFDNSYGLAGSNYDFSSIPAGATIDGIGIRITQMFGTVGTGTDNLRLILETAADGSENKNTELGFPPNIPTDKFITGTTDLWSETISRADVQNVAWGYFFSVGFPSATDDAAAEALSMQVWYTTELVTATGTVVGATETQIAAGGRTILLDLTNVTWAASGGAFDAQRQGIIDGIDSAQSETLGWNLEVRDKMGVGQCVRTNNTRVTITLSAVQVAAYKITADEVLTATIPASAHSGTGILTDADFATITAECDQTLPPDTIATQTNLTGAVTDIDESVDSPDANWLVLA